MNDTTSVLKKWHQFVETKDHKILDEILTEEVVFHSPVVWTPQYGKSITKFNGVDMMEINTEGKITSFKVMIRPLQAINKVHEKMGELLKRMQS